RQTGHFSIAGSDRFGFPLGLEVIFSPPLASIGGRGSELGEVLSSSASADRVDLEQRVGSGGMVRSRISAVSPGVFHYEVVDWNGNALPAIDQIIASDVYERYLGLGEKFDAIDQTGKRVHILTADTPGNKGGDSYKVVPWMMSTRGFGVLLDSTAESDFDLRSTDFDRMTIEHHYGTLA